MQNLLDELINLLSQDKRLVQNGRLFKNKVVALALKPDRQLLKLLCSHPRVKNSFFSEIGGTLVFDKIKFQQFVNNKEFLPDSYTAFKNKIGLQTGEGYLRDEKEVVLSWPFKDCLLEGGQTGESSSRGEVLWHEVLASEEIDTLLAPKVFCNFRRYTNSGNAEPDHLSDSDNLIIKGNNLIALHSLKKVFAGRVKLIYIDPPYNTGNDGFGYNDRFNHSTWLTFMKNRLEVARDLLSDNGSLWINIDDGESHYLKVLCDELFGRENFVINFIWQKKYSPANDARWFSDNHDHILVYAKNKELFRPNLLPRSEAMNRRYANPDNDPRGPWKPGGFSVKTYSKEYDYPIETPSGKVVYPPKGSCWQTSRENYRKKLADNRIYFGPRGDSKPQLKQFLSEVQQGVVCKSIWPYDEVGHNQVSRSEILKLFGEFAFSTPKPEKLLKRIIDLASSPGERVLDFFMGSGTTPAVAHKTGRKYIGIEQMDYIEPVAVKRLQKVIEGENGGISKEAGWNGGGSFVFMELKKLNMEFIDRLNATDTCAGLEKLFHEVAASPFANYRIGGMPLRKLEKHFSNLKLPEKKQLILDMLDKNQLYLNLSEMEDEDHNISPACKRLNQEFYKLKK